jgi:hypothetical protein
VLGVLGEVTGYPEKPKTPSAPTLGSVELTNGISAPAPAPAVPNADDNEKIQAARARVWAIRQAEQEMPNSRRQSKLEVTQVNDLQSFILDAVPYGLTTIDNVQNRVLYDGPDLPATANAPQTGRPALYWYFDDGAHKIVRAIAFQYTYQGQNASGVYVPIADLIYVGFEGAYTWDETRGFVYNQVGTELPPTLPSTPRALPIQVTIAGGKQKLNTCLQAEMASLNIDYFNTWQTGWVEFAGPARDATSVSPFTLTVSQLVDRPEEFNKLLFWQVGGRPQRVAKAMRLQCFDNTGCLRSILVGYQGAGGTSPG